MLSYLGCTGLSGYPELFGVKIVALQAMPSLVITRVGGLSWATIVCLDKTGRLEFEDCSGIRMMCSPLFRKRLSCWIWDLV